MNYKEILDKAREVMMPKCRVCPDCNGLACKGEIPGLGGIGSGNSFTVCRDFLKNIKILMDVTYEGEDIDTDIELFGKKFDLPFFIAPLGGMNLNYTGHLKEHEYIEMSVKGINECGGFSFTPDGIRDEDYYKTIEILKNEGGIGVPTVKPWEMEKFMAKVLAAKEAGIMAVSSDVDSCGNLNLKNAGLPVYPMSKERMEYIVKELEIPFIPKGIMTAKSAKLCADAGCYGIVVSNHGGRVIEDSPAPLSMLPEIREAVGNRLKIFVDGGIRSGADVFKALALGADAVLIGRPYVTVAHGGGKEGIKLYTEKILSELKQIMLMTACKSLKDITRDKVRF